MNIWLIGAGSMAREYAKVLNALDSSFEVIGRGINSVSDFEKITGFKAKAGGISKALKEQPAPEAAIVAVGVKQLAEVSTSLIKSGTRRILLEKPGGLNFDQIRTLNDVADEYGASVWLAYNRRFYASTLKAEEMIAEDKGALSVHFEFTEWSHTIRDLYKEAGVKEHWFLGNSTHVVDLVVHLCGVPKDWHSWHSGSLDWHPTSSRFVGAGVTDSGTLFSYLADWEAPGRWGVEILTRKRRYIFRPMEELHITSQGSVEVEHVSINNSLDLRFKPGLFRQTMSFLQNDTTKLCSLSEQVEHTKIYSQIAGYKQ
jgi:predicted dehydrogenase